MSHLHGRLKAFAFPEDYQGKTALQHSWSITLQTNETCKGRQTQEGGAARAQGADAYQRHNND